MSAPDLPGRARVVIIGGGVIGCSVAYHLAHEGWTDVVVLERDRLTSGTTWHAAGLMTCFGSTSETSTGIRLYSRDLYARLEAETGVSTGFKPVGLIEAAADADRQHEYRRVAAFQRHFGLEVEEIGPQEMSDLFPWAKTDDLLSGFYVPGDGRVNPVDLTQSLARGAKDLGVRIVEGVRVEDVLVSTGPTGGIGRVTGVRVATDSTGDTAEIEAEYVVNCTGMWARELAEKSGVVVPNQAAEHYYLITDTIEGLDPNAPVFEDPAAHGYYREEGGGMMVGLFEPRAAAWAVDGIPAGTSFTTLKPDWDRMSPFLETAMARVPVTLDAGVRTFFCGPESFTPDLMPAVGEAPSLRNYFVAAGMNSVGILSAGGLGRVLAHWIISGLPDVDVTAWDVARFRADQLEPSYRRDRTTEILGTVYAAHTPGKQLRTARDRLLSPVHQRLVEHGGLLREVSGWEGADWFAGRGVEPVAEPTWGRAPWFEQWAEEHRTVREGVGLMDMSFMAKFAVLGKAAGPMLDHLSAGEVNGEPGWLTYTQWLNDDGRIEADLTVGKITDERMFVIASDTGHGHVRALLDRAADGRDVTIRDLTAEVGQLNLQGPLSRDVLAGLTDADLSTEAWPFRGVREIEVAGVPVICARITYLGELGYELYADAARCLELYDALLADERVRPVGLKALASLRMEKAYRDYGHDIDNTDCPLDVGLGFAVAWDTDFRGKQALLARKASFPSTHRLVQVRLTDPEPLLHHAEPVLRDGVVVGYVRAASYGWTLGAAVGLAFVTSDAPVTKDWLDAGSWQVDIAGERHAAEVSLRPMYDPTSARVRA
ncbi:GcvT family protein [Nocardioides cynanchi]|uniref:GcvT family protein n=1 Tax=Nocardioides cynanchi TaxID=2558918 RepID=UPI0012477918|nr:FAD-dependent oxidoreductase [Nocardioides cynanchi]